MTIPCLPWADPRAQHPLQLLPSSKTEASGWQILSMSPNTASSTKHHICAHSSPKEFGGELLSNLHNLYVLHIIARVCGWVALRESRSCFPYHPIDRRMAGQRRVIVISEWMDLDRRKEQYLWLLLISLSFMPQVCIVMSLWIELHNSAQLSMKHVKVAIFQLAFVYASVYEKRIE